MIAFEYVALSTSSSERSFNAEGLINAPFDIGEDAKSERNSGRNCFDKSNPFF